MDAKQPLFAPCLGTGLRIFITECMFSKLPAPQLLKIEYGAFFAKDGRFSYNAGTGCVAKGGCAHVFQVFLLEGVRR